MTRHIRIIALVVLLLAGATSLMALPDHEIFITYYTDNTYTVDCGYKYIMCYGSYSGGCKTQWFTVEEGFDC